MCPKDLVKPCRARLQSWKKEEETQMHKKYGRAARASEGHTPPLKSFVIFVKFKIIIGVF